MIDADSKPMGSKRESNVDQFWGDRIASRWLPRRTRASRSDPQSLDAGFDRTSGVVSTPNYVSRRVRRSVSVSVRLGQIDMAAWLRRRALNFLGHRAKAIGSR